MDIVLLLTASMLLGVAAFGYVIVKFFQVKKKNDLLTRRDKASSDTITTYESKLRSLAHNKLSFVDKMKHDFRIKEVLSSIANHTDKAFCATACLFHNGGHIPTQLSMIYEECNHNSNIPHEVMVHFQGIRTNKIYQQLFALIDGTHLKINEVVSENNHFEELLSKSATEKYLAFCIKYDDKTPLMFVGVHFTKDAELTPELIANVRREVMTIEQDVINLFAYKLKT